VRFELPFDEADVRRAQQVPVTPALMATATFEGVRAAFAYWMFYLRPVLQGLIDQTPRERSFMSLFYRVVAYIGSIWRLDGPIHVQAIAGSARSLFELGLDIALFSQDWTNDSLQRLEAFTHVERYRVAAKLVAFYAARPLPRHLNITQQRRLVADAAETNAVETLVERYWGRNQRGDLNWPKHWSRFQDARGRAQHVGGDWEERYVEHYYMLSWHIHSGLAGVANLPRDVFDSFAARAHQLTSEIALDCYATAGEELHLSAAMRNWHDHQNFLCHVIGMALVDRRLHSLGEPVRFLYLEPEERL
jgi:hypothetical protein